LTFLIESNLNYNHYSLRKRFLKRHEASSNIVLDTISPYTTIIFTSWDFSISSAPGVSSHRTATATALKVSLFSFQKKKKKNSKTLISFLFFSIDPINKK